MDSDAFWIILVAVLGSLIGSFLNVVIYRLPLGLSISQPRWSFCPHCEGRIKPYHNIPIVGWLALRGRCASCARPISVLYPLIECATALMFVMVWDALFIGERVPGIHEAGSDWPMAVAYLTLFAGLLATAAMDVEAYAIDIRVSVLCLIVGVAMHAIRGVHLPTPETMLPPAMGAIGTAMAVACAATLLVIAAVEQRRGRAAEAVENAPEDSEDDTPIDSAYHPAPDAPFQPAPVLLFAVAILAVIGWQIGAPALHIDAPIGAESQRGFVAWVVFMMLLIAASLIHREADDQIVEDIETERPQARATALRELAVWLPTVIVGLIVLAVLRSSGRIEATWGEVIRYTGWAPHVAAGANALTAALLAAGVGWSVRILGTLGFGKEAFGTGDIYIMASIAAVMGFWASVFAFFLAAILALIATAATIWHKRRRAIPFGPWLALGAFVTLWLEAPLAQFFGPAGAVLWSLLSGTPLQFIGS